MARSTRTPDEQRSIKVWTNVFLDNVQQMGEDAFYALIMPNLDQGRDRYRDDVEVMGLFAAWDRETNTMNWDKYRAYWVEQYDKGYVEPEDREPWHPE